MKKRIVICCDGTWNRHPKALGSKSDDEKTNVQRMFECTTIGTVSDNVQQLGYYDAGMGSGTTDWRDRLIQGLSGEGLERNTLDAYTFLCMNYFPGDDIFLFGFSRGAYTVRSLAGLIRNCGILTPNNLYLVGAAYDLYKNRNNYATPDSSMMKGFKKQYTPYSIEGDVRIKLIGVWDTVGTLGIPENALEKHNYEKYKFHDLTLSSFVSNAYHALAVDETRKSYKPALWYQSPHASSTGQVLEQRWFVGAHHNVGGGYQKCTLQNITLKWMASKARAAGLDIDFIQVNRLPVDDTQAPARSSSFFSRMLGTYHRRIKTTVDEKGNPVVTCETIDDTVIQRCRVDYDYRPVNLKGMLWV